MGLIPNKTYTAPDGSIYRVEADGSVTKIKGGRVQSNEPSSKYNITPDGKIYRVESDGSITYLGNAEDRKYSPPYAKPTDTEKSGHKWIWAMILAIIIAAATLGLYITNQNNTYSNEVTSDYDARYAFIVDGNYYGTIGNARIHGKLTLDTTNPCGVLYYTDNGNGEALEIYGSSDGKTWTEYYNDENTGRIDFSFWDLAYTNFASGTYTRTSDGKQFTIKLYKSNF